MRKKPGSQGSYNNNQARNKPRFQGHNGQGGGHNHHNRPRKNYPALRERYLAQGRDALAAGDRVLAENWFQHAEHCYRMMVEEGYNFRNNYTPPAMGDNLNAGTENAQPADENIAEGGDDIPANTAQLPAFLTASYSPSALPDPSGKEHAPEPVIVPHWEE